MRVKKSSKATEKTDTLFKSVKYGKQTWMVENLNAEYFRNGDLIPEAKTDEEWLKAGENGLPAWCFYNNDPLNGDQFGKLYNWYSVNDPRGLAPEGWLIPEQKDWNYLIDFLGGEDAARPKMKEGEFLAFSGGIRLSSGQFVDLGEEGGWWSKSDRNDEGWSVSLVFRENYNPKACGLSVRCIRKDILPESKSSVVEEKGNLDKVLRTVSLVLFCLGVPLLTIQIGRWLPFWAEVTWFGISLLLFYLTLWVEARLGLLLIKTFLLRFSWVLILCFIIISEVAWTKPLGYAIYGPPFPEFATWRIVVGCVLGLILIVPLNLFLFSQLFSTDRMSCDEIAGNILSDYKRILVVTFGLLFLP